MEDYHMSERSEITQIHFGKPIYKTRQYDTLRDMIRDSVVRYAQHTAFRFRDTPAGSVMEKSYSVFLAEMNALGTALASLGLLGGNIAVIGENRYEWALSYLAVANGVGVVIPLDRMLPAAEIEAMLVRGEVDALFYSAAFEEDIRDLSARNSRIRFYIRMNDTGEADQPDPDTRFLKMENLMKSGGIRLAGGDRSYLDAAIDPEVMKILLFTSGTSATSKAVMLSHRNLCADVRALAGIVHADPGESVLSVLPLHHTFENTCSLLFSLNHGMTVAISDGLKFLSKNLVEYQPAILIGVPLIFEKFRKRVLDEARKTGLEKKMRVGMKAARVFQFVGIDIRRKLFFKVHASFGGKLRVMIAGGAAMDSTVTKWYEGIGIKVYQGYGLTETAPVIAGCNDRIRRAGTCGQPLPEVEMGICNADDTGTGEIVVRGPMVMLGYWKDAESTNEAIRNGWFHTGDLGRFDRLGLLHVTGRSKSMIVLKTGKKVFPEELEALLGQIAYVKESIVWGECGESGDVEVCARIVVNRDNLPEHAADDDEFIHRLLINTVRDFNKTISPYKAIRHFVYGESELAKTTTLKVKRYLEIDELHRLLTETSASIRTVAGKNIDLLKEAVNLSMQRKAVPATDHRV